MGNKTRKATKQMFKNFAIAMLAIANMASAKKLCCDSDDTTCMQVTRESSDGQRLFLMEDESVTLQLSNQLINQKKLRRALKGKKGGKGKKGKCHWKLQLPSDGDTLVTLEEGSSQKFGDLTVTAEKAKYSKFSITAEGEAGTSRELNFINSCDIPSEDEEDRRLLSSDSEPPSDDSESSSDDRRLLSSDSESPSDDSESSSDDSESSSDESED